MKKNIKYIVIMECLDPFLGLNAEIYDSYEEAQEIFTHEKKMNRFAELYKAELIEEYYN